MAYCRNCGTFLNHNGAFCERCGAPTNPQTDPRPKVQGRGLAIASMVLGIIGMVCAVAFFFGALSMIELDLESSPVLFIAILYSALSVLALIFSAISKSRGNNQSFQKTGFALGLAGAIIFFIDLLLMLTVL